MKITIVDGVVVRGNKVLLLKKYSKNYYEFPGGKLREEESVEECLFRELKEELNINVKTFEKLKRLEFSFEGKEITDHIFIIKDFEGEIKNNESEVFEKLEWQDLEELNGLNLAPNVEEISPLLQQKT